MSRIVFVTGGSGFIGNAVARHFAAAGYQVYGLIRSEDKSKSLLQQEITPVIGEVNKPETYEHIVEKAQIIVHTASGVTNTPLEDDTTVVETVSRVSAKSPVKKLLILTSGCLLYGGKIEADTYFNEDSELNIPPWIHWRRKVELQVLESKDFIGTVARPGWLYGSSGSWTAAWFGMVEQKKPVVSGNPDKKWSFIHVDDLAEGYLAIAEAPRSVVKGEIFNFADGSRSTLKEVVQAAAKAAGCTEEISYVPVGNDFVGVNAEQSCLLDCSKARKFLGWVPKHYGFVEGIHRYYAAWKAFQK